MKNYIWNVLRVIIIAASFYSQTSFAIPLKLSLTESTQARAAGAYLVAVGAYQAQRITHDGGYEVSLPSGEKMRQGADGVDVWIRDNL